MTDHLEYPLVDLALARRLERTEAEGNARYVAARARLNPDSGAVWQAFGGTFAMFDGIGSPVTQTFGLGLFDDPTPELLAGIERFFQDRGSPVFHEVSPLAPLPILGLLHERGYRPIELTSVMYQPVDPVRVPATSARISVSLVGAAEEQAFARTMIDGWSLDFPEYAPLFEEMARVNLARTDVVSLLASLDGTPAAAGAMSMHDGVVLLAGACTVPAARNQGLQKALVEHRLHEAAVRGCNLAMMCATPGSGSQRNGQRQGFRIAYTRIKWQLG